MDGLLASIRVHVPLMATDEPTAIGLFKVGSAVHTAPTDPMPPALMLIKGCAFITVSHAFATLDDASSIPYMSDRLPCNAELGDVTVVAASLIEEGEPRADKGTYQS